MHISDQIAAELIAHGFENNDGTFSKLFPTNGEFGLAKKLLMISDNGRWLSLVDGWEVVIKDCDLREFNNAPEAITAVLN